MKTLQIILLAGISIATVSTSNAQLLTANLPAAETKFNENASPAETFKYSRAAVMATKSGVRAVKNFRTQFNTQADEKWHAAPKVISASFENDGIRTMVVYNSGGNWIRTMKFYQENKMPADLRELVKRSRYYDFSILTVQEIIEPEFTAHVVYLEDAKSHICIVINNGEIAQLNKIKKQ